MNTFRKFVFPSRVTAKQDCDFNKLIKPTATEVNSSERLSLHYIQDVYMCIFKQNANQTP